MGKEWKVRVDEVRPLGGVGGGTLQKACASKAVLSLERATRL